jgi:hypothetical protein
MSSGMDVAASVMEAMAIDAIEFAFARTASGKIRGLRSKRPPAAGKGGSSVHGDVLA